ncbi:MAG: phosphotransferase [Saprospiraceae bacterium]
MSGERQFLKLHPNSIFLSKNHKLKLQSLLQSKGILGSKEMLKTLSKAGDGNMNCVIRAVTTNRSIIIKQSRPWVEKYPHIAAPIGRINVEAKFIKITNHDPILSAHSPLLLGHFPHHYMLIMSDLGDNSDYSHLYSGKSISTFEIATLCNYLNNLHGITIQSYPDNYAMRHLNHEHIFDLPFKPDNGLSLDEIQSGLSSLAESVISDEKLVNKIKALGAYYLYSKHSVLIHGDFYPGSFMKTEFGLKVIDAEFSFIGPAEFDWGVLLAHLFMSKQQENILKYFIAQIEKNKLINSDLVFSFGGVEILRRILGVAQLPLSATLDNKNDWVENAKKWLLF